MQKVYRVEGVWKGRSAGGCVNHPTWRWNPQIFLTVSEAKTVTITLAQRGSLFDAASSLEAAPSGDALFHIGLYVLRADPANGGRRQLSALSHEVVGKCRFENSAEVSVSLALEPGVAYVVVPCTFRPGQESAFVVAIASEGELNVSPLPAAKEWKYSAARGEWRGMTAGGCRNFPSFPYNPQFLVKVRKTGPVRVLVSQTLVDKFEPIGLYAVETTETENKLRQIAPAAVLAKSEFIRGSEAMLTIDLKARQKYALIPCTFNRGFESRFTVELFSESDTKITPLKDPQELVVHGEWLGSSAGGCINSPTWRNNPQYFLLLNQNANVTITLSQQPMETGEHRGPQSIGFYLARSTGGRLVVMQKGDIVGKAPFEKKLQVSLRLDLEKSETPYVLIPATFHPDRYAKFTITCFVHDTAPPESILKIFPCHYHWHKKVIEGAWTADCSGGCRNYATWLHNPQVHLTLARDSQLTIILSQMSLDKNVGFYILRTLDQLPATQPSLSAHMEPLRSASRSSYVAKSVFNSESEVFLETTLPEGSYVIVICTFEPRQLGRFSLTIYSNSPGFEIDPLGFQPSPTPYDMKLGRLAASASSSSSAASSSSASASASASSVATSAVAPLAASSLVSSSASSFSSMAAPAAASSSSSSSSAAARDLRSLPGLTLIRLDEVSIESKIGQGGFGMVYKGTYKGQTVAIKKLFREEMDSSDVDTFEKEVELMTTLDHPKILKFIGASLDPPDIFIATEFMDRGNLTQVLRTIPDLDLGIKLRMAIDAAEGVEYLHSRDPPVVHRDLKSLNLLVAEDFTCRVADFGLSKVSSGNSLNSKVGSLNWCAPEVLLYAAAYTPASDAYSFGMILWELLTHSPPFAKMHPLQIVRAIDRGDLPTIPPTTPDKYRTLVLASWNKDAKRRPTFTQTLLVLRAILAEYNASGIPLKGALAIS